MSAKPLDKVDNLALQIRHDILSGRYPPGTVFQQEILAKKYNVSRTPIREALQKLAYEGYLELGKRRQFKVPSIDYDHLTQLYRVREVIDGLGTRLLAEDIQRDQSQNTIRELESILDYMEELVDLWDVQEWSKENVKFHSTIIRATENRPLINLLPVLNMSAKVFYPAVLANPKRARLALDEHRLILRAIRKGEADLAENIARFHIRSALKDASPYMKKN